MTGQRAHPQYHRVHPARHPPVRHVAQPSKRLQAIKEKALKKLIFYGAVIIIILLLYYFLQDRVLALINKNYYTALAFNHMTAEIAGRTLLGLFYASFFGSLFFIMIPVELLFGYYLLEGYSPFLVAVFVITATTIGMIINYGIGRLIGKGLLKLILKQKFTVASKRIEKYGSLVVFFGNVIIFPMEAVAVVLGAVKFPFKKYLILTFFGRVIKFWILIYFSGYLIRFFS